MAKKRLPPVVIEWSEHRCHCRERETATLKGEFIFSLRHDGFVFPNGPKRKHNRLYVYPDCPWCFGELPRPAPEGRQKRRPTRGGGAA